MNDKEKKLFHNTSKKELFKALYIMCDEHCNCGYDYDKDTVLWTMERYVGKAQEELCQTKLNLYITWAIK